MRLTRVYSEGEERKREDVGGGLKGSRATTTNGDEERESHHMRIRGSILAVLLISP